MGCHYTMQEINKPQYAGFFVRLSAAFIDGIIVFALLFIVRVPMWLSALSVGSNPLLKNVIFRFSFIDIVIYLLATTYYVLMIYYEGATLGKKLLNIKVIGEKDKLSFFTVFYRETIGKYISTAIMCIGYFLIGVDSQKRGLHDILCDTWVVYDFEEKNKEKDLKETYLITKPVIQNESEKSEFKDETTENKTFELENQKLEKNVEE